MTIRKTDEEKAEDAKEKGAGRDWRRVVVGGTEISKEEIDRRVQERIAEYYNDFETDALTGIDKRSIRNLAMLEVRADIWNEATMNTTAFTPHELEKVASSISKILAEARAQSIELNMTRRARTAEGGDDLSTYLPHLHKEALDFIKHESIIILCEHCLAEPPRVEIRLGYILSFPSLIYAMAWEDPNWQFTTTCPRCKKIFTINTKNYTQYLYSKVEADQAVAPDDEEEHEG